MIEGRAGYAAITGCAFAAEMPADCQISDLHPLTPEIRPVKIDALSYESRQTNEPACMTLEMPFQRRRSRRRKTREVKAAVLR
ncbi:MAG: hypothetical protein ACUVS2_14560 [Candidatus Flexifilum sp.]